MEKAKVNNKPFVSLLFGFLLINLKDLLLAIHPSLQTIAVSIGLFLIFINPFICGLRVQNNLKGWVKYAYLIYLIWLTLIALIPVFSGQNYSYHSYHPYSRYGLFSYIIPFVGLFGVEFVSFRKTFGYAAIFSVIGFVSFIIGFNDVQTAAIEGVIFNQDEGLGSGQIAQQYFQWFILSFLTILCLEFVPKRYRKLAIFATFFSTILMLYLGRRGSVFMFGLYSIGAIYLYLIRSSRVNFSLKFLAFVLSIIMLTMTIENLAHSSFNLFFERLNEDTRSTVDLALMNYLTDENAWLFGKGIEGTYPHDAFSDPRYVHETGYLYLILKGGLVNLFLFVYLMCHAAFKGLYRSRNRLVRGLSFYVLLHVIYLIPFGIPTFTLEYVFLWISFVCCESSFLRGLSNEEIKDYINGDKKHIV